MAKYVIIDGNSIGYAAHQSTKLRTGDIETQAIFGFIKSMRGIITSFPQSTPMVLWDGRAQWRFDMHPLYKSNRDADPKQALERQKYKEQKPYIIRAMSALAVRQMTALSHEADDMAGYLVKKLSADPTNEIDLITGDGDWKQLVRQNVRWHDNRDADRKVTHRTFLDKTGYITPLAFLEGKALQGDGSDMIGGVGKIGKTSAPILLATYGSVRNYWRKVDAGEITPGAEQLDGFPNKPAQVKLASKEGRLMFGRNLKLMQLLTVVPPAPSSMVKHRREFDLPEFLTICEEFNFKSIIDNLELFTKPFMESQ